MPKVSVVIAAYNMANYLPLSLDSALAQDYPDFEVIVLDDGSTDNTRDVVASYGDRVRYHWQPNQGVAVAYSNLLLLAAGDYIHHLDADDILLPGALKRLAAILDDHAEVGLAYGMAPIIDATGRVYSRRKAPRAFERLGVIHPGAAFKELLRGCHITTSTVMLRKSVLETVAPFQPQAVPGEDWDMWMRVAAEYALAYTTEPIAQYRIHDASITAGYTVEKVLASHQFTLGRIFSDPHFRFAHLRSYAYACHDRTIALTAARGRERGVFARRLLSALRRHPGMIAQRETMGVLYEGAKAFVPSPLIAAGRRMRGRHSLRGGGA